MLDVALGIARRAVQGHALAICHSRRHAVELKELAAPQYVGDDAVDELILVNFRKRFVYQGRSAHLSSSVYAAAR